jgi:phosphohistidine phosphatase
MKTLYLMRHAKSSWDDTTLPDRDRPLDARGKRDATKMSKRWAHDHAKPDLILSSPAVRALATARLVAKGLDYKLKEIAVNDRLYAATAVDLIGLIGQLDDKLDSVMLVGHNPELTDLARHLSSEITHMPTCALAEFKFRIKTWSRIGQSMPAQATLDSPKQS